MERLRLVQTVEGGGYRVEVALVRADGGERSAARFTWELTGRDREDIR
ncbi:MAG: hypothetical protein ACRD0K_16460 [Egibacteraceae bacterium]